MDIESLLQINCLNNHLVGVKNTLIVQAFHNESCKAGLEIYHLLGFTCLSIVTSTNKTEDSERRISQI